MHSPERVLPVPFCPTCRLRFCEAQPSAELPAPVPGSVHARCSFHEDIARQAHVPCHYAQKLKQQLQVKQQMARPQAIFVFVRVAFGSGVGEANGAFSQGQRTVGSGLSRSFDVLAHVSV